MGPPAATNNVDSRPSIESWPPCWSRRAPGRMSPSRGWVPLLRRLGAGRLPIAWTPVPSNVPEEAFA